VVIQRYARKEATVKYQKILPNRFVGWHRGCLSGRGATARRAGPYPRGGWCAKKIASQEKKWETEWLFETAQPPHSPTHPSKLRRNESLVGDSLISFTHITLTSKQKNHTQSTRRYEPRETKRILVTSYTSLTSSIKLNTKILSLTSYMHWQ